MSRRTQETLAALVFLALFVGAAMLALEFGPRARMIPLPLAIFGAVLALVQLALVYRGATHGLQMDLIAVERPSPLAGTDADASAPGAAVAASGATKGTVRGAYAIVAGLLALVLGIGPVAAVFVFTAAYFIKTRYCSAPLALLYAAACTFAVYVLFFLALQIQPYHGILAPLIEHWH